MKKLLLPLFLCFIPSAGFAAEPSWRDYPGVTNSSYVEPSGARAIQLAMVVRASPERAFDAFATEDGFKAWAVSLARVDLRQGGEIESSYDPKAKLGDPENIRNRILAFIPNRLLVLQNVQAPHSLPGREAFAKTITMVEFLPVDQGHSRIVITNAGYGSGSADDAAYRFFEAGDAYTLDALRKHLEK